MQLYGYHLVELPIIDSSDLFLVKAGDQIINSLFTFERQGKQLALRPEFTASAADYFARTEGNAVARWQFAGPVFEDKAFEHILSYEQLGVGAELIGLGGSLADAEIIAMSAIGLDKLGISDAHISIGHIGLIRELLKQFGLDTRTERFLLHHIPALYDRDKGKHWIFDQFISHLTSTRNIPAKNYVVEVDQNNLTSSLTMGGRTQEDIMQRMLLKKQRLADRENVFAAIDYLDKWCQVSDTTEETFRHLETLVSGNADAEQLLNQWHNTISLLEVSEIDLSRITIRPGLARSWEYYTGMVFELHGNGIHLGGGGRYDDLAQLIGSKEGTPAVGFTYYGDRLINALSTTALTVEPMITIISSGDDMVSATKWANCIRNHGIPVQILSQATRISPTEHELYIEDATTAYFQASLYDFQQIDVLINNLKQIQ